MKISGFEFKSEIFIAIRSPIQNCKTTFPGYKETNSYKLVTCEIINQ